MTISKAAANKTINECFNALPHISVSFSDVSTKMYNMEYAAEKQHRSGRESVKGFSVGQAAKYFTVKHLFDAMEAISNGKKLYTVADIIHIRNECLYAQAYVEENYTGFIAWYKLVQASDFGKVDYSELMK